MNPSTDTDTSPAEFSHRVTLRVKLDNNPGVLAKLMQRLADLGGNVGAIDIVKPGKDSIIRDITINTRGEAHEKELIDNMDDLEGVEVVHWSDRVFLMHLGGKIEVHSKSPLTTRDQLSIAYTPGVARVCMAIHDAPEKVHTLTIKHNTVAVVTDGTAVLGLGDIGPEASLPVMEGKAMLFREFAGVDAFPICLNTKDPDEIVETVKRIAPVFGGINLEDIAAPQCFEIERRLREELDIPVFHDDQHGTAVVATAALINALKVVGKKAEDLRVIVAGVGAAGTATTQMMLSLGVKNIIGFDRKGAIYRGRDDLNSEKQKYAEMTNPDLIQGSLKELMRGADVFVGLSGPDILDEADVEAMADDAIVFAMSNPTPEIMPEVALRHARIVATGRSDFPNQINNVLCFPGLFRGVLDCRAGEINEEMKMAAAQALASVIEEETLSEDYIIPSVFDREVVVRVSTAVQEAALRTGVARKTSGTT
ncbi:MAG: NAD-dependent malic enzyme [Verrucomicrobiales bacterium]|nr:NAD-dependent malic enzyme [Verrucomicrobiales bacterium]